MAMNVAIVSDFYFPFVGGVEIHIKQLAKLLSHRIGKVIVITHKRNGYEGIRNDHGFTVYYLNIYYHKSSMYSYPTFLFNFPQAKRILYQENIDIVHCHQTSSSLALQFIFFASILQKTVVLTEHSLVGLKGVVQIVFNRICTVFMPLCSQIITVSRTTRNNLIQRTYTDPSKIVVVPNGVSDISHIIQIRKKIKQNQNSHTPIKIVSIGRMTYRRGTDLLIQILPELCKRHKNIQIFIIGDGIKKPALEKCIHLHGLSQQVKLLGVISNHDALLQKVAQCDIFLNTPLTESFGIALAEAAMLGLHCISTNVGGIQEAIPSQLLSTAVPQPKYLLDCISHTLIRLHQNTVKEEKQIPQFMYDWEDVADRTIQVYKQAVKAKNRFCLKKSVKKQLLSANLLQFFFLILAILLFCFSKLGDLRKPKKN